VDNLWISRPCGADLLAIARPHNRSRGDLLENFSGALRRRIYIPKNFGGALRRKKKKKKKNLNENHSHLEKILNENHSHLEFGHKKM
jgi:hypothetical protein